MQAMTAQALRLKADEYLNRAIRFERRGWSTEAKNELKRALWCEWEALQCQFGRVTWREYWEGLWDAEESLQEFIKRRMAHEYSQ